MEANFVYRPKCELCGSERKQILVSVDFSDSSVWDFLESYYNSRIDVSVVKGVNYEVAKCLDCDFVWQVYVLNEQMMDKLYNVWISEEHSLNKKKYADGSLFDKYAREARSISHLLNKKHHQIRVLDFGMGWGHWCRMAKAFGYDVKGFEVSPSRIAYAKEMGIDVIESYNDINKYTFDFINSEQVFEHISNPLAIVNYLSSRLEIGGIIKIAVPNGSRTLKRLPQKNWKAAKNALHPLEHINCFTHHSLKEMGKRGSLEYLNVPQPIISKSRKETIFNIIAKLTGWHNNRGTDLYFRKVYETSN